MRFQEKGKWRGETLYGYEEEMIDETLYGYDEEMVEEMKTKYYDDDVIL